VNTDIHEQIGFILTVLVPAAWLAFAWIALSADPVARKVRGER
jgi:hypothetical protein